MAEELQRRSAPTSEATTKARDLRLMDFFLMYTCRPCQGRASKCCQRPATYSEIVSPGAVRTSRAAVQAATAAMAHAKRKARRSGDATNAKRDAVRDRRRTEPSTATPSASVPASAPPSVTAFTQPQTSLASRRSVLFLRRASRRTLASCRSAPALPGRRRARTCLASAEACLSRPRAR